MPIDPANDPNEAYEVVPSPPELRMPNGWLTVTCNGIPMKHYTDPEKARRYATDPEYRAADQVSKKYHDRKPR